MHAEASEAQVVPAPRYSPAPAVQSFRVASVQLPPAPQQAPTSPPRSSHTTVSQLPSTYVPVHSGWTEVRHSPPAVQHAPTTWNSSHWPSAHVVPYPSICPLSFWQSLADVRSKQPVGVQHGPVRPPAMHASVACSPAQPRPSSSNSTTPSASTHAMASVMAQVPPGWQHAPTGGASQPADRQSNADVIAVPPFCAHTSAALMSHAPPSGVQQPTSFAPSPPQISPGQVVSAPWKLPPTNPQAASGSSEHVPSVLQHAPVLPPPQGFSSHVCDS